MRILIFGAKGQLGRDLLERFALDGEILGVDLPEIDITDPEAAAKLVSGFAPDLVVNAAAYTNVEKAEEDRGAAFAVNEAGARHVAAAAGERGLPVVYYSTDYVFDGAKREPYEPGDPIAPLGVYAESKAVGERATAEANPRHFIMRTAWLYGPGGNHFIEKILRAAASRPSLRVVQDECGSPTHTYDLAEATRALCQTDAYGIYHAVNEGACTRYEFAKAIIAAAGLGVRVEPCGSEEFPTVAPRPLYSVLSNQKLEKATGFAMRPWRDALAHYMQRREDIS
ncbi:MAG: dTDP-4-dehydrorhamnose reductase [Nitrospiraceae bacterium]|nr:dTDP-4-dehydrorhamnose reductase [Nitrospiraceae bacterium]